MENFNKSNNNKLKLSLVALSLLPLFSRAADATYDNVRATNSVNVGNSDVFINKTGVRVGNKISISATGIGMAGQKITSLADATADSDAVTYKQLRAYRQPYVSFGAAHSGSPVNRNSDGAKSFETIAIGQAQAESIASIAMGYNTKATGGSDVAIGAGANSTGLSAVAVGAGTQSVYKSVAIGASAKALQGESVAIGSSVSTNGPSSIAIGDWAGTNGEFSMAFGTWTKAEEQYAIALGYKAAAKKRQSVAIGLAAVADGNSAMSLGNSSKALGDSSIAMGKGTTSSDSNDLAIGSEAASSGGQAMSLGFRAQSTASKAIAIGSDSRARGVEAVALGHAAANANYSIALGSGAVANNEDALATGHKAIARGENGTTAYGAKALAVGTGSLAVGSGAKVAGLYDSAANYGAAFGFDAQSTKIGALAAGWSSRATGESAIAIGHSANAALNKTIAIGENSAARKINDIVIGNGASTTVAAGTTVGSSVVIGTNASTPGVFNNVIGNEAASKGSYNAVFGSNAEVKGTAIRNSNWATAVGYKAVAFDNRAVAVGAESLAEADSSVALGYQANATGRTSISIGKSTASHQNTVAISTNATASGLSSIAIGLDSSAVGGSGVSLGNTAKTASSSAIAIGTSSQATELASIAIGLNATSNNGWNGVAVGRDAKASGGSSIAQGNGANASAGHAIAVGSASQASASKASAFGISTVASGSSSLALGDSSKAKQTADVAIGAVANAEGGYSVAIGEVANSTGAESVSIGRRSSASGHSAISLGASANATGARSISLGRGAQASTDDSVALGSASETQIAQLTNEAKFFDFKDDTRSARKNFAGYASRQKGTISVGTAGFERQIHHVAPGRLSETSTDAVNGSQLYYVLTQSGFNVQENSKNKSRINNNGLVNFINGNLITANVTDGENSSTVKFDVTQGVLSTDAQANTTATKAGVATTGEVATSLNIVRNMPITFTGNSGTSAVKKLGDSLAIKGENGLTTEASANGIVVRIDDNTRQKIDRIITAGQDTSASVSSTDALTVKPNGTTQVGNSLVTDYKIDLSDKTKGEIQKGVEAHDAVTTKGLTFTGDSGSSAVKKLGDSVAITGDDNITTEGNANGVQVKLNKDITVDSVTAGDVSMSKNGINAGGKKITNVADGEVSATSKDAVNGSQLYQIQQNAVAAKTEVVEGTNVKVDDSQKGKDGHQIYKVSAYDSSAKISAGSTALSVKSGAVETVVKGNNQTEVMNYVVDLSDNTKKDISDAKNNAKDALDIAQKGWEITATASEGGTVISVGKEKVAPGETVTVEAGKNIVVTHKQNRVMNIAVNSSPTFDSVISKGDVTVNGKIHANGGLVVAPNQEVNMGGNRITNVAKGVNATDAVNKSQLDNAINNVNYNINRLDNKIDNVDKKLRAGIAGATAISFLQQPNGAGKSRVSMGVGGYRNEQAIAVGYGRNSDNNKVSLKVGGSVNSRGDLNWGGSVGYEW